MDLILYEERKSKSSTPLARYRLCTVGRDVLCNRAICYITAYGSLPVWYRNSTPAFKMVVNLNCRRPKKKKDKTPYTHFGTGKFVYVPRALVPLLL